MLSQWSLVEVPVLCQALCVVMFITLVLWWIGDLITEHFSRGAELKPSIRYPIWPYSLSSHKSFVAGLPNVPEALSLQNEYQCYMRALNLVILHSCCFNSSPFSWLYSSLIFLYYLCIILIVNNKLQNTYICYTSFPPGWFAIFRRFWKS